MSKNYFTAKLRFISVIILLLLTYPAYALNKEDDKFYQAVQLFLNASYNDSLKAFGEFTKTYPQSLKVPQARLYEAKALYYQKQYYYASVIIDGLLSGKYSSNSEDKLYYWAVRINYALKQYSVASNYSSKLIHSYPKSDFFWPTYYILARIYLKQSKLSLAEKIMKKIIIGSSDKIIINSAYDKLLNLYCMNKDYSQVMALASRYLKRLPQGRLRNRMYFYRAEGYYNNANYSKAVADYTDALFPEAGQEFNDLIYEGRGLSFIASGNLKKAKLDFSKIKSYRRRLFSYGIYYLKAEDYLKSLDSINTFLNKFPHSDKAAAAYLNKAESLYRLGRINDSLYAYQKVITNFNTPEQGKNINRAYYGMARDYFKDSKFKQAIEIFKNIIRKSDDKILKIDSLIALADSYKIIADWHNALSQYSGILKIYPKNNYRDYIYFQIGTIMLRQNKFYEAISNFNKLENEFPASRFLPEAEYYTGFAYLTVGDFNKAAQAIGSFIAQYPRNYLIPKAYYLYGKSLMGKGNYQKALGPFLKVLAKPADNDTKELAYINIIQSYYLLSDFSRAIRQARNFLRLFTHSPKRSFIYLYLGRIYQHQAVFDKAEYFYEKVLEGHKASSAYREAVFSLGVLYMQKGFLSQAQSYFKMLDNGNGSLSFKAKLYLGDIYLQQDKKEKALDIYKKLAIGKSKIVHLALAKEAFLLEDMDEYSQAVKVFREVLTRYGDSARIRFALGLSLEKINRINEAIAEYLKIIYNFNIVGDKVKAYFRLAKIYERKRDFIKAKDMYQKIIATGRNEAKVARLRLNNLTSN